MGKTSGLAATETVFVLAEHQNMASSFSNLFGNWSAAAATQRWLCLALGPHLDVLEDGGRNGGGIMDN